MFKKKLKQKIGWILRRREQGLKRDLINIRRKEECSEEPDGVSQQRMKKQGSRIYNSV